MSIKLIEVVAAVVRYESKFLTVQRGNSKFPYISYKWEFPGGKVEPGESCVDAIQREMREELNMTIINPQKLLKNNHSYPDFTISLQTFICTVESNELTLTEHVDFRWLEAKELNELDWAAADIPIVLEIRKNIFL